ncbi:phosphopantetheine-binding protein, partial [Streptomyces sp. NPDC058045]|uniref:phosphopantetheine-binding protein n=1 Tax=Streptomyces sp. NPDC058045 TaxID=3346311 RepID=UPI0036E735E5
RWEDSPFFVNREVRAWPERGDGVARRGGVSAFGFSGTNAHVVLESCGTAAGDRALVGGQGVASAYVLPVSAKSEEALERALLGLADHLEGEKGIGAGYVASVAHTLSVGRHHFAHRCAVVARDVDDAVRLLREAARGEKPRKVHRGVVAREFTPNAAVITVAREMIEEANGSQGDPASYQQFLMALADFYCQGYEPSLEHLFAEPPAFVSLPTQPFLARHCWVGAHAARQQAAAAATAVQAPAALPATPALPVAVPEQRTTSALPLRQPAVAQPTQPVAARPVEPAERTVDGSVRLLPVEVAAALVTEGSQAPDRAAHQRISLRPLTETEAPAPVPAPQPAAPARPAPAVTTRVVAAPVTAAATPAAVDSGEVLDRLQVSLAAELFVEVEEVDPDRSFTELGLDSVVGVEWVRVVNEDFGTSIGATRIYQYPNLREFAGYVASQAAAVTVTSAPAPRPVPQQPAPQAVSQPVSRLVPERVAEPVAVAVPVALDSGEVLERLQVSLAAELFVEVEEVDPDRSFTELGLDSVVGVEWVRVVNEDFGTSIGATRIYQYPNLREFTGYVAEQAAAAAGTTPAPHTAPPAAHQPASPATQQLVPEQRTDEPVAVSVPAAADSGEVLDRLQVSLAAELFVEPEEVDPDRSFTELGLDSVVGVEWIRVVNEDFGTSIGATRIYQYPNLREFAAFVTAEMPTPEDDLAEVLAKVYDGQIDVQQAEARLGTPKTEA